MCRLHNELNNQRQNCSIPDFTWIQAVRLMFTYVGYKNALADHNALGEHLLQHGPYGLITNRKCALLCKTVSLVHYISCTVCGDRPPIMENRTIWWRFSNLRWWEVVYLMKSIHFQIKCYTRLSFIKYNIFHKCLCNWTWIITRCLRSLNRQGLKYIIV